MSEITTLYLQNLNEKILPSRMKLILFTLFSGYGKILSVTCKKSKRLRGQAWISFKTAESAANARTKMNNKNLYGKPLKIHFAKAQSDKALKVLNPEAYKKKLKQQNNVSS
eukprot:snap_masked-scaffold_13-processed-gene-7.32-mRNA-1 protein AED:0.02 eAED:0.02 QI:0/-1/0/1/-1/1/1/0/110